MTHAFNPDWTLAPAATLQDWMDENGLDIGETAVAAAGVYSEDDAIRLIREVLDAKSLDHDHAIVLALCTGISTEFWLNSETRYRNDLEAGLTDSTWS